jgi:hypothetical protein
MTFWLIRAALQQTCRITLACHGVSLPLIHRAYPEAMRQTSVQARCTVRPTLPEGALESLSDQSRS